MSRPRAYVAARRYARDLRTPDLRAWHGVADPRSWVTAAAIRRRRHPSLAEVRRVARLARSGREGGRFLATLPRSGTNWLTAMLDSAHSLTLGLDGDFDYVPDYWPTGDPGWAPRGERLVWPVAALSLTQAVQQAGDRPLPAVPVLGSHYPLTVGIHRLDDGGRPVVLVRHPAPAIRSLVHMREVADPAAHRSRALKLAREHVRFLNHWSDVLQSPQGWSVLVVRYEQLVADPSAMLAAISAHWSMALTRASITGAVDLCSRDRMRAKAGQDPANTRVSVAEPPPLDHRLAAELDEIVAHELRGTFGYDLDDESAPSTDATSATSRSEERPSR